MMLIIVFSLFEHINKKRKIYNKISNKEFIKNDHIKFRLYKNLI